MKINYLLIPLFYVFVSTIGSLFTGQGVSSWYKTINLPSWTPPGSVIGIVWTIIFILTAISALIVWNKFNHNYAFWVIAVLFLVNGLLNIFWSYLFFSQNLLGWAALEAALLGASVYALIVLIWPLSTLAASLLIPYAGWVTFATYLTYLVYKLNL